MIRVFKSGEVARADILYRGESGSTQAVEDAVADILADVKKNGDAAVLRYCEKFDGVKLAGLRVAQADIDAAYEAVDPEFIRTLRMAAGNIEAFHKRQIRRNFVINDTPGVVLGQKVTPIERVGLYVPGGTASYPSSVLMNAIPARLAGVSEIIMVTPPAKDGSVAPAILTAARVAGVTAIYKMGGAQAVAALAYGTETIEPVCKITGPGNAFVAAAKKIVSGDVGIDMIAGPSEVCVVADETADPAMVAIDLMAQAEHDPLASCYLVTFDEGYADKVEAAIEGHMKASTRAEITTASLADQGLVVICDSMEQAIQSVNVIAPEHLELHFDGAFEQLGAIRNAGAIFVGEWTPEAVGDYVAGPNHTLPTGGTARYASPLSTDEFVKHSSVIQYSAKSLANDADAVIAIARHEGLWAHARSVELRKALVETGDIYGLDGADE